MKLNRLLVPAAIALTMMTTSVSFAKNVTIRAGLIDPPGHIDVVAAEKYAELVAKKTDGSVKIEVYPAAQLGFAMDMLQGLKLGTVQMFIGGTTWLGAFDKDFWISGCLYVFNDQEQARNLHQGPIFATMTEKLRKNDGIRLISQNWDRGARNFISKKPLHTPEDLNGLKIRVPGQKSWIANFELAGASPTPLPLSETFTALQQGLVESTEQASNWLYFNKYNTIAENLIVSNHNYEETGLMISEPFFQSLDESQQKAIEEAAVEIAEWHNAELAADIAKAEAIMAKEGVNIIQVDQAAWQKHFRANFDTLVEEIGYSKELTDAIKAEWK